MQASCCALVAVIALLSAPTLCQEWQLDAAGPVRVHFESRNAPAVQVLKPLISEGLVHIAAELRTGKLDSADLYLAADRRAFHVLTDGRLPDWGAGCAFPARGEIYLHLEQSDPGAYQQTIVHELAHVILHRRAGHVPLPRWFDEGVSMWLAREWELERSLDLALAVLSGRTHSLAEVEALLAFPEAEARRAYSESLSAALFLRELGGRLIWADLLDETARTGSFEQALSETLGMSSGGFDRAWRQHIRAEFNAWTLLANSTLFWMGLVGLTGVAYALTRYRARRLRRSWAGEEESTPARDRSGDPTEWL